MRTATTGSLRHVLAIPGGLNQLLKVVIALVFDDSGHFVFQRADFGEVFVDRCHERLTPASLLTIVAWVTCQLNIACLYAIKALLRGVCLALPGQLHFVVPV